jgi:WS/DGAT/MGAT family acyltransferase
MARYAYERLKALDNSFLVLEKPTGYMHVASTQVFEAGPLRKENGGIDADAFKALTEGLLHLIPRYRQRLAWIPIENHPVWVDDERFNVDYHIRHTSLPRPGSEEQLKRLSARIMQQHLDRRRPLWEMWLVEGLERDRFAIISKVHHCMIDGVSGVDLMRILMTLTPEYEIPEAPAFIPRPAPSGLELLRDEVVRRMALPFAAVRGISNLVREARDVRREVLVQGRALMEMLGASLRRASETPLNREIGPHRRFDWLEMDLAEIKAIRKALGGTLNDVVLTIVTGAMRGYLNHRRVDPDAIDFRVLTPVSVRAETEQGALGNRVSAWIFELPIGEADPRKQLLAIHERTTHLKESKSATGAEVLTQVAEWTPSMLLSLGARNVTRLLPFNLVVTNVPGPQIPMYSLGCRMLASYPHVPLTDYLGLGIALMSYDGSLAWGFNADYDLVPDLATFVTAVQRSFEELRALAKSAVEAEVQIPPPPEAAEATTGGNGAPPADPGTQGAPSTS